MFKLVTKFHILRALSLYITRIVSSCVDPLKLGQLLCGSSDEKKLTLQTVEMFNGRMSMLAAAGYSAQEYFTGMPVVRETPQFFTPWLSAISTDVSVVTSAAISHGVN